MLRGDGSAHWVPDAEDEPRLRALTCSALLDEAADTWPERDALIYSAYADEGHNVRWSFAELQARARQTALALAASGCAPGERIAVWASNVPEWLLMQFGAAYAGLVLVPLNPVYTRPEVVYVLRRAEVSALFVEPVMRGMSLWEIAKDAAREASSVQHLVALGEAGGGEGASWEQFLAQADGMDHEQLAQRRVGAQELAQIQFTSGTTGFPKGAMLRHGALTDNARMFAARAELRDGGRVCSGMPQFHCGGSVLATMGSIATGSALMPLVTFNAGKAIATVERERATALCAVPAMLLAIESELSSWQSLASLERIGTGGSLVPPEIARRWHDRLGVTFTITYGLTEASPVITQSSPSDSLEHQVETVGKPLPNVECDVCAVQSGETVAIGEEGEVRVRGWQVMAGYYGDEQATADAITSDGWLRTGDLGRMDADGYLRITGRAKDMIIRGGENLYPAEIEAALRALEGVVEAFVVGVPDERYGEVPAAFLRLTPETVLTLDDVREGLAGRVARFKIPSHVTVVEEFPLTSSGKVQKFKLREQFLAERVAAV